MWPYGVTWLQWIIAKLPPILTISMPWDNNHTCDITINPHPPRTPIYGPPAPTHLSLSPRPTSHILLYPTPNNPTYMPFTTPPYPPAHVSHPNQITLTILSIHPDITHHRSPTYHSLSRPPPTSVTTLHPQIIHYPLLLTTYHSLYTTPTCHSLTMPTLHPHLIHYPHPPPTYHYPPPTPNHPPCRPRSPPSNYPHVHRSIVLEKP